MPDVFFDSPGIIPFFHQFLLRFSLYQACDAGERASQSLNDHRKITHMIIELKFSFEPGGLRDAHNDYFLLVTKFQKLIFLLVTKPNFLYKFIAAEFVSVTCK